MSCLEGVIETYRQTKSTAGLWILTYQSPKCWCRWDVNSQKYAKVSEFSDNLFFKSSSFPAHSYFGFFKMYQKCVSYQKWVSFEVRKYGGQRQRMGEIWANLAKYTSPETDSAFTIILAKTFLSKVEILNTLIS